MPHPNKRRILKCSNEALIRKLNLKMQRLMEESFESSYSNIYSFTPHGLRNIVLKLTHDFIFFFDFQNKRRPIINASLKSLKVK